MSCLAILPQQAHFDWSTKTAFRLAIQAVKLFNTGAWSTACLQSCCTGSMLAMNIQVTVPCPALQTMPACLLSSFAAVCPRFVHPPPVCSVKGICCAEHEQHKCVCRVAVRVDALVTSLQAIYRGARQRRAYLKDCQHVVRLQAAFRAFPARMQFLQAKGAAIWIQSCWRRHQAQQHVLRTRVCSVSLVLRFST